MISKDDFDRIIRNNLAARCGSDVFGYQIPGTGKIYDNYYANSAFSQFIEEMKTPRYRAIYESYRRGKGSELEIQLTRHGTLPPKMASVASSSRFCYLALRDGGQALRGSGPVHFEHECRIPGISGTAPQLDAYIPAERIYVEAKCHEIFTPHRIVLKKAYWNLIYGPENHFGFPTETPPSEDSFEISLSSFGIRKKSSMFDIKQLLCHLLGIAAQQTGPKTLVYLFFKPISERPGKQQGIDEVFDTLEEEIRSIFHSAPIEQFCRTHQILLRAAAECSAVMEPLNSGNIITIPKNP